ncbi:MAG: SpoIVB peptidase [Clostridia bacterium]|nr:SpoIVB peptidase [Clostridia bacterium]
MKNKVRLILFSVVIAVLCFTFTGTFAFAEEREVYLGGTPLGIGLAERGLIVTGFVDVITDEGTACPARGSEILTNDVIVKLNGKEIVGVRDFASALQGSDGVVTLTVKRGERDFLFSLAPVTDSVTGLKKLGITVKTGISGIGTLTFVLPNGRFGALGHGIVDADTGKPFFTDRGSVYSCNISGFRPANGGKAGELIGRFVNRLTPIGQIDLCNGFGVYGEAGQAMTKGLSKVVLGSKRSVKTGKAQIYSTISGGEPKMYEIEIVKLQNQKTPKEKSMLIRVTDRDLLSETGGILQGMSGSPIVQDGKLVGAVTHVLLSDAKLGYGLYIDWMLPFAVG